MRAFLQDMIRQLEQPPLQPPPDPNTVRQWRTENRPLVDRLADLLKTIPDDVQRAGIPLRTLQQRLRGRTPGCTAHHAEIAQALRQLGFYRERRWRAEDNGFRALWKRD